MVNHVKSILVIQDLHIPYHSKKAIELLFKFLELNRFDEVDINGDLLDCFPLSKYARVPGLGFSFGEEVKIAKELLKRLRTAVGEDCVIKFIEGNHDFRVKTFLINQAPELYHLPELAIPYLLDLSSAERNIEWLPTKEMSAKFSGNFITYDDLHIGHFEKCTYDAGMAVRNIMTKRGGSIVQAHGHKAALIWRRDINGKLYFGMEAPALYEDPPYAQDNNWQLGWGVINEVDGIYYPQVITLQNYSFFYGNKFYSLENEVEPMVYSVNG